MVKVDISVNASDRRAAGRLLSHIASCVERGDKCGVGRSRKGFVLVGGKKVKYEFSWSLFNLPEDPLFESQEEE